MPEGLILSGTGSGIPLEELTPELVGQILEAKKKAPTVTTPQKKHKPLSVADQEFNRHIYIRAAGHDDRGKYLGDELLTRDIRALLAIEEQLIVDPVEIEKQITLFGSRLEQNGNDMSKLSAKEFSFLQLGGHISRRREELLLLMQKKGGYSLLLEHVPDRGAVFDPTNRVPLAYNDGFISMPVQGEELPIAGENLANLDAANISGREGGLADIRQLIWKIWRAGVMNVMDQPMAERLKKLGIAVPDSFMGISAQKRGFNNAFKVVVGEAAKQQRKKWIMYNTAMLMRPDEVMDASLMMPNMALRGSNEGVFVHLFRYVRNQIDKIIISQPGLPPRVVAEAHWDLFGNDVDNVLKAERDPNGILMSKGGFDYNDLIAMGDRFHEAIQGRSAMPSDDAESESSEPVPPGPDTK